jgi:hypothetical protein
MRPPAKCLFTAGCLLLVSSAILPQNTVVTNSVSSQLKYDDSESGLKREFEDAVKVAKKHDGTNLVSLTTDMALPDPHLWFTKVFGAEIGAAYEKEYALSVSRLPSKLADVFEKFTAQKSTDLKVLRRLFLH